MFRWCLAFLLSCSSITAMAQTGASELETLQKQIEMQQQQLDALKTALEKQRQVLEQLQEAARAAASPAAGADPVQAKGAAPIAPAAIAEGEQSPAPLAFRIGGADFTPGGFVDVSAVWRSTNVGSGVATAFGSIPSRNTTAGQLSEWRFSSYNSRMTLKVTERPFKNRKVLATGYFETDFAGALPNNAYVTGNSNTFRVRQAWISVQTGRFEILGGQAWTLMTPNRTGTSSAPSDVFLGLGQDSAYLAGLIWVRPTQFRATYRITPHWTFAFSAENPQQYVTNATTLPADFVMQFDTSSGNSAIANARPDFIGKLAYDTKVGGKSLHLELAALSRHFRTLTPDNIRHSAQGLGGSFNMILEPVRNLRMILTTFYSSGGGRYIMGLGPDVIVSPDGSLSPVHSTSGIAGLEYQFSPGSQGFAYYSGAYFSRNYVTVAPGSYFGFGYPGSPNTANRQIQEATMGYIRIFWKNPNYGAFQALGQYTYLTRSPWHVASRKDQDMSTHMVFAGLRFTLP
jgi:hypothetical protein